LVAKIRLVIYLINNCQIRQYALYVKFPAMVIKDKEYVFDLYGKPMLEAVARWGRNLGDTEGQLQEI
jgi:hypothetical protein